MRKFMSALCAVIFLGLLFTGCSGVSLSEQFDEKDLQQATEKAIAYFSDLDFTGLRDMMHEDAKEPLNDAVLQSAYDAYLKDAGALTSYKGYAMKSQEADGMQYATVVMRTAYEKKNYTYTLAFDEAMKITAFYIK